MTKISSIHENAKKLHLSNLKNHTEEILSEAKSKNLSYEAFLEFILDQEIKCRQQTARIKRIREAHFPYEKRLEELDFNFLKAISPKQANQLAELVWLKETYNIVLLGPPGTGKTHLAISLGYLAAEEGFSVSFLTVKELLDLLKTEEVSSRSRSRLERVRKSNLVIIDEVGYLPVSSREAGLFFHLLNDLHEKASLIITSNKPFNQWAEFFGDSDMVLAALDRILYKCEIILFEGESYRMENRRAFLGRKDKCDRKSP